MPLVKAESLKKAILEHPDLPLVFFCEPEIWAEDGHAIWPATNMSVRIGKVLTMKDSDTFMRTFTDEDEDDLEDTIRNHLDMSDKAQGISDEEYEEMVQKELDYYNAHWKDCIIVRLGA